MIRWHRRLQDNIELDTVLIFGNTTGSLFCARQQQSETVVRHRVHQLQRGIQVPRHEQNNDSMGSLPRERE
jgi:hypothetical protein